ncbi:CRISPR-associated protein Cas4 [Lihuaxuella thermophila]|uniref:CRISPR-associated exonuclease Cas4 n=1 Tax=Lihuaxuella thermophila TaxID=1173111 RepID=A0A1H8D7S2_9BACL|nr:CRISPR-associated protein Cas4 [Lihuaxuella thermophila]SEN02658.1 CRISPR-associated exonuclease Cas4 [Lihuaxuella thermophila]
MDIRLIGGQHFYYLESCKRQLWLYIHKVNLEENFESVELGRLIHDEYYQREDKEIRVDGMLIDFISRDGYVHETKSSKKPKKEHEIQPLFYAYYLKHILGYEQIKGAKIHYPLIKQVIELQLDEKRIQEVEEKISQILMIAKQKHMPEIHSNIRLCRKCAYFEFCHI